MRINPIFRKLVPLVAFVLFSTGLACPPAMAGTGTTDRVSADSGDAGGRELPAVSEDGRYVIFVGRSAASWGVYLHDRLLGMTTRLTNGNHMNPAISANGRYVAYSLYDSARPVYVLDRETGSTTLVSVASDGTPANGLSDFPALSRDGRFVAFQSTATNLDPGVGDPGPGGGPTKVYVHDNLTGQTKMVSVTDSNVAARGNALHPAISADGRYVAFASDAPNLVPVALGGDPETETGVQHVFVHDRQTATTTLASISSGSVPGDAASAATYGPSFSADGSLVAFESDATNLVAGDTNVATDVFVHNRSTGATERVSVTTAGAQITDQPSLGAAISGNGRFVAFESLTAELDMADIKGVVDVFVHDRLLGRTDRASLAVPGGTDASGTRIDGQTGEVVPQINGYDAAIDHQGRYVAFVSNGDLAADRALDPETGELSTEPSTFVRSRPGYGAHNALVPARILDTRTGLGGFSGTLGAGQTLDLQVTGAGGVPADGVAAVVLSAVAVQPMTVGYLTVFPTGAPLPATSNQNLTPGESRAFTVTVAVGNGGKVSFFNYLGQVHLVVDVQGWYSFDSVAAGGGVNTGVPARILDSRFGVGGLSGNLGAGQSFDLQVTGAGGVPATEVDAVILNLTACQPTQNGNVAVVPTGSSWNGTSNLNYVAGQNGANLVIAKVGTAGKVTLHNSIGTTGLIADVLGWVAAPGNSSGGAVTTVYPMRILDTRTGLGGISGKLGPGGFLDLKVTGTAGVPEMGVAAVLINVTAVQPSSVSYIAVIAPSTPLPPSTSNLNVVPGANRANLVLAPVGPDGMVRIFNANGLVHVIVDVQGWVTDL